MLSNYIRITLRNMRRHPGFTFINVTGLATGMAAFVLIVLFIQNERSFDTHNEHADDVYRVVLDAAVGGQEILTASSPAIMATQFQEDFPEIVAAARLNPYGGEALLTVGNTPHYQDHFIEADSSVFDIFSIRMLAGDPATALNRPNTMVLSQSAATKLFGSSDPVGQMIRHDNRRDYEVTGVYADLPYTSTFRPAVIASFLTNPRWNDQVWLNNSFQTYIRLQEGADPTQLQAKFPDFLRTYVAPQIEQFTGSSYDDALAAGMKYQWALEKLSDIYLYSKAEDGMGPTGDIRYLYILGIIGIFVLTIACINFMNLSTARATGRAREVGIRKTLGSDRTQLVRQFLGESIVLSLISMVLAAVLVLAVMPLFARVSGSVLRPEPWLAVLMVGVALFTGLLSGLYPAGVLSGFKPALVLKGSFASSRQGTGLRSALVVFQFSISVILLVGTSVVYKQLNYIQNKDLGFTKDQVVVLPIETEASLANFDTFRSQAMALSGVKSVASAGLMPGPDHIHNNTAFRSEGMRQDEFFLAALGEVSHDYVETLGLTIIAGRDFSDDFPTDTAATIINRAAALAAGLTPETAVGTTLFRPDGEDGSNRVMEIIGVFEDANFESLHQLARPMVIGGYKTNQRYLPVRIQGDDVAGTLAALSPIWTAWEPGYPFRYYFMDSDYQQFYEQEQRLSGLYTGFTVLAILIACLGLFGLASFVTALRTKEIGVRKVMGASVPSIVVLLSKEFTRLVLVACLIGFPIAWYAMNSWLQEFAYATEIGWGVFALSGISALVIAWLTVSYQSIRAATADPVKSLHYQ